MNIIIDRKEDKYSASYTETFEYNGDRHVSVINLLDIINSNHPEKNSDGTVWRLVKYDCSCEQGLCGACAMVINGHPGLACQTFCDEAAVRDTIRIQPLSKFPVVCDLVTDRSILSESLKQMKVWIEGDAQIPASSGKKNTSQYEAAQCLMCGCCLEVCPNYAPGSIFTGAFGAVNAMNAMKKNENGKHLEEMRNSYKKRFYSTCSKSGACEKICPAGLSAMTLISEGNRMSIWGLRSMR
jgi:succinate dehydrogenase / fumarate reductase iron-sulfur subunit